MPPQDQHINGVALKKCNGIPLTRAEGLLLIMDTPKGRGVFACRDIPSRTILDVCPVLILDPTENEEHVKKTTLYNYTYNWPYKPSPTHTKTNNRDESNCSNGSNVTKSYTTTQAVVLGLGSMFNHSNIHQNVGWERDLLNQLITYSTLRDIKQGEELCISYGQRLTFKDAEEAEYEKENGEEDMIESLNVIDLSD